jgi:hypothetical protein
MQFARAAIQGMLPSRANPEEHHRHNDDVLAPQKGSLQDDRASLLPPVSSHAGEQGLHLVGRYGG